MYETIAELLRTGGFAWTVDGDTVVPTESDVERIIDQAIRELNKLPRDGSTPQYEIGGIIVQKNPHGYDVYCHVGVAA